MRFTVKPGQCTARVDDDMIVIFDHPDDVTLPPALGGGIVRVDRAYYGPCPRGHAHQSRILVLAHEIAGRTLCVAECGGEFIWYTKKD